ncbi:MAG: 2TM domain-containing protein [Cyclobacteriaceae bacterium]|nr:2TM domain-containing protein [Cyclobacteriaceae bacterium]
MQESQEVYEKTKKLLKQLNRFLIHVVLYFISNAALTFYIFQNIDERWWLFFFIFAWAIGMIYHALLIYGIDIIKKNDKKLSKVWGWV